MFTWTALTTFIAHLKNFFFIHYLYRYQQFQQEWPICFQTIWSVRDISRDDRARIATCSLRTATDRFKPYCIDDLPRLSKNEVSFRSIGQVSILLRQTSILSLQNCLYLLRSVYSFLKQVSVSDVRLQKRNFGRKWQINICPKLGFDARNFVQFSIRK